MVERVLMFRTFAGGHEAPFGVHPVAGTHVTGASLAYMKGGRDSNGAESGQQTPASRRGSAVLGTRDYTRHQVLGAFDEDFAKDWRRQPRSGPQTEHADATPT